MAPDFKGIRNSLLALLLSFSTGISSVDALVFERSLTSELSRRLRRTSEVDFATADLLSVSMTPVSDVLVRSSECAEPIFSKSRCAMGGGPSSGEPASRGSELEPAVPAIETKSSTLFKCQSSLPIRPGINLLHRLSREVFVFDNHWQSALLRSQ